MKKSTRWLSLILSLVLVLCTMFATVSAVAEKEKVVRMWTFLDPENKDNGRSVALKQMMETFEAENPGVKIVVEPQDYNIMSAKFLAAASTGDAPDIIWCTADMLGAIRDAGYLEPFENLFIKDWAEEELADIADVQWDFGAKDGYHYQIVLNKNIVTLYYRADLFEANNIEIPTTWDELVSAAQKLTGIDKETGVFRYGLGLSFSTESSDAPLMFNMLTAAQGSPFNDDGSANWNNEAGAAALQFQIDCIRKYGITPEDAITATNEDLFLGFYAGKYAMIVGGAVRVPNVKAAATFDPDAVQLMLIPGNGESRYSPCNLTGWCVGVWSGSQVKEEAGKFVETMVSPESDNLWVTLGGQAPIRKSTITNNAEFFDSAANRYLTVMSAGFSDAGWMLPDDAITSGWTFDLNRAMQNVLIDGMSVEEALESTANDYNTRNGY